MRAEKAHRDMDDRVEAFEIEPSYSEDPFTRGPRVLWGRVAALGGGLILFFLIGHWTGGGGGGSSQQVTTLQRQVDQDRTTIQQLQQSLAAASQAPSTNPTAGTTPGAVPAPDASSTPTSTATAPATSSNGQTYKVKAGDTLGSIAAKFYGRTNHDLVVLIEQANGMVDTTVRPGQSLTIPPAPKASAGTTTTVTPKTTPKATASATPRTSASPTR
jgi:LysM repeat protein